MSLDLVGAVESGEISLVTELLSFRILTDEPDRDGEHNTALHIACRKGNGELASLLLRHNFSPNDTNEFWDTPLHISARQGSIAIVALLLSNGARIDLKNRRKRTPFHEACDQCHEEVISFLLEKSQDSLSELDSSLNSPLHLSCYEGGKGKKKVIQFLLEKGANPNIPNELRNTPLHFICDGEEEGEEEKENYTREREEILEIFCQYNANINLENGRGMTPLHLACEKGDEALVNFFLKKEAKTDMQDAVGNTPLHIACAKGDEKIVQLLLKHGAQTNHKEKGGYTPFLEAVMANHPVIVDYLLRSGQKSNEKLEDNNTPLHKASESGFFETVKILVINGAPLNEKNKHGCTPLHLACFNGHQHVVNFLLRNGALYNERDEGGFTSLHRACEQNHPGIVGTLLDVGADPNTKSKTEMTPLHMACVQGHIDVVKILLQKGASPNEKDNFGSTGLHRACDMGNIEMVSLLLKNKADPNITAFGWSPLEKACKKGYYAVARELLNYGGLIKQKSVDKLLNENQNKKNVEMICLLVGEGGDPTNFMELFPGQKNGKIYEIHDPKFGDEQAHLFPLWRHFDFLGVSTIDLSGCRMTRLPLGLTKIPHPETKVIKLRDNPLTGLSKHLIGSGMPLKQVVKVMEGQSNGDGKKYKAMKLLVVGEAAAGKTTLVEKMRGGGEDKGGQGGEGGGGSRLKRSGGGGGATDGIDLNDLFMGGIRFSCWDFAGQELYRYTHQLFLSGVGIYLVVINLTLETDKQRDHALFWMESVTRCDKGNCILVGTRTAQVHNGQKMTEALFKELKSKFSSTLCGYFAVDSVKGLAIDDLKNGILKVAKENMVDSYPSLLRIDYECERLIQESEDQNQPPVISLKEIQERLPFLGRDEVEGSVLVLHSLGSVVVVRWERFEGEEVVVEELVVLDPKWLIGVLKAIVTEKYGLANALLTPRRLASLWSHYPSSLHEGMKNLLEQLDILIEVGEGKGEGGKRMIVPCLLTSGECDLGWEKERGGWRRGYVLEEGERMPVGVAGRVVGVLLRVAGGGGEGKGAEVNVWKNGGGVRGEGWEVKVWVDWWGQSPCVYVVVGVDFFHVKTGEKMLKKLDNAVSNILTEYYHVTFNCHVILDPQKRHYIPLHQAYRFYHQDKKIIHFNGKTIPIAQVIPDKVVEGGVGGLVVGKDELKMKQLLGRGGFGEVYQAELVKKPAESSPSSSPSPSSSSSPSPSPSSPSPSSPIPVAVKRWWRQRDEDNSVTPLEVSQAITEWMEEMHLMIQMDHPNIVRLYGVCMEEQPPWLVLELMERSLSDELFDPLGLMGALDRFSASFDRAHLECAIQRKETKRSMKESLKENVQEIQKLTKQFPKIEKRILSFLEAGESFWNNPTKEENTLLDERKAKLKGFYDKHILSLAPLPLLLQKRIALDIALGLAFLHHQTPPMIHRDMKPENIFVSLSFDPKIREEQIVGEKSLAKIGDFGLSVVTDGLDFLKEGAKMKNISAVYAAPEVLKGKEYSTSSDIFSFGSILYELSHRKNVFGDVETSAFREMEIKTRVEGQQMPKLLDTPFSEIISKCWHINPLKRPTAQSLVEEMLFISPPLSHLTPSFSSSSSCSSEEEEEGEDIQPNNNNNNQEQRREEKTEEWVIEGGIEMPPPKEKERSHRIVSSVRARGGEGGDFIWVGLQTGHVGAMKTGSVKDKKEGKEGGVVMSLPIQVDVGCPVNTIVYSQPTGTVWSGSESGRLSVWRLCPVKGSIAAEQYYSTIKVEATSKRLLFKHTWTTTLELLCGTIQWTSKSGESHSIVVEAGVTVGREGCEVFCEGGGEKFWGVGGCEEEVKQWVEMVKACRTVKQQELSLRKVAEKRLVHPTKHKTPVGIMRLVCNSGSVWSVDTTPMVTRWEILENKAGTRRGPLALTPLQCLSIPSHHLQTLPFVGGLIPLSPTNLWVAFGSKILSLSIAAPFSNAVAISSRPSSSASFPTLSTSSPPVLSSPNSLSSSSLPLSSSFPCCSLPEPSSSSSLSISLTQPVANFDKTIAIGAVIRVDFNEQQTVWVAQKRVIWVWELGKGEEVVLVERGGEKWGGEEEGEICVLAQVGDEVWCGWTSGAITRIYAREENRGLVLNHQTSGHNLPIVSIHEMDQDVFSTGFDCKIVWWKKKNE